VHDSQQQQLLRCLMVSSGRDDHRWLRQGCQSGYTISFQNLLHAMLLKKDDIPVL